VRGSTYDNARNLPPKMLRHWLLKYENTRMGRQELMGELLDDVEGALWEYGWFKRVEMTEELAAKFTRIVVAVDPAVTVTERSDYTGIVVAARDAEGNIYILADKSEQTAGEDAARRAWAAFLDAKADTLIYEGNQGGVWVGQVLTDVWAQLQREGRAPANIPAPVKATTALVGKSLRAQPVALRYEQGRVFHCHPVNELAANNPLDELEQQLITWVPDSGMKSPDRLDALVWACTELMTPDRKAQYVSNWPPRR